MATVTPMPAPEPKPMSFPARVVGVFFSPDQTFADIARRPSWIAPVCLLALLTIGMSVLGSYRIPTDVMRDLMRTEMMKSERFAQAPVEQQERQIDVTMSFVKYGRYAGPIQLMIILLVMAGILHVMANFVLGAEMRFKTTMSVTSFAVLPGVFPWVTGFLTSVLSGLTLFLKDPKDIDLESLVISNLGPLVSNESSKVLHRLLSAVDLFSIWVIILLAIGISAGSRLSFKKSLLAVLVPWGIFTLGALGIAAIR